MKKSGYSRDLAGIAFFLLLSMRNFQIRRKSSAHIITTIVLLISFGSCKEKDEGVPTIKFLAKEVVYSEADRIVKIPVTMDGERNIRTKLGYKWTTGDGTTFFGGDFDFNTENVLFGSFQKVAHIELSIIEDEQLDTHDIIFLQLQPPADAGAKLSDKPNETIFKVTINNNDVLPPDTFQADLTWHRSNPYDRISEMNLDLYVQTGLKVSNGQVTDLGKTFTSGANTGGFETIKIKKSDPKTTYFIVVFFQRAILAESVTYTLTFNGMGFSNKTFTNTWLGTDVGAAVIYTYTNSGREGGRTESNDLNGYQVVNFKPPGM